MRTTIIAVRHGETEWNKIERQQGHLNSGLTELGKQQARAMGGSLRSYSIGCFYASDLGRAVETAEIIAGIIGLKYESDVRLRERNLGILQGLTTTESEEKYPQVIEQLKKRDPEYRIPNGESMRERYERHIGCAESLAGRHPGQTLLIVGHGGVLMSFIQKALSIPLGARRTYSLYNGSLNLFSISDVQEWNLEVWGEAAHLRSAGLSTMDDS